MFSRSSSKLRHLESKLGHQAKSKENLVDTLEVKFLKSSSWILLKIFVLMISRWSLELGHLWRIFHDPVTFLRFSVLVSFSVTIETTEWYLALMKCFCLSQFLSCYSSYGQWYLAYVYILAWPLECSHTYLTLTSILQSDPCHIVLLVNIIIIECLP